MPRNWTYEEFEQKICNFCIHPCKITKPNLLTKDMKDAFCNTLEFTPFCPSFEKSEEQKIEELRYLVEKKPLYELKK